MYHRGNRGARYGRWPTRGQNSQFSKQRPLPAPLGPKLKTITLREGSTDIRDCEATISDCEFVASYNLTNTSQIIVPGNPPAWVPLSQETRLQPDTGSYYRDENSARFRDHPMDPTLMSIKHLRPAFDTKSIDIVACGSTLGNLLRFVQGRGEPFTFTVDVVGQTVLFARRNASPTELIEGIHGFGHSFVEANTMWHADLQGSASHQRIVSYMLGGKRMLVRFEVDAYIMDQTDFRGDNSDGGVSVEDAFEALLHVPALVTGDGSVKSKGSEVAQSSLIDIKTRSYRKQRENVIAEQLPRCWLRQLGNLVLSFHNNGLFEPPTVEDISSMLLEWEADHEQDIGRLVNVIDEISKAALLDKKRRIEVRYADGMLHLHKMSLEEQGRWNAVSADLREWWTDAE